MTAPEDIPFSQDEARFRKTLNYSCAAPVAVVERDMEFLQAFDRYQEKRQQIYGYCLWGSLLGVVAGVAVATALQLQVLGAIISVAAILACIVTGIGRASYGRLNLEDRRYRLVAGVLRMIAKDMAADAQVSVKLDFKPHNHKSKFKEKGPVRGTHWNARFYDDQWLQISGALLDGTKFSVSMIEKQQDRYRTKRSASGKMKTKTKTKNSSELVCSLRPKEKRYDLSSDIPDLVGRNAILPPWVAVKSVRLVGNALTISTKTKSAWEVLFSSGKIEEKNGVTWVTTSLLSLYQTLNAKRRK